MLEAYLRVRPDWNADSIAGIRAATAAPLLPTGTYGTIEIDDAEAFRPDGSTLSLRTYVPVSVDHPAALLWIHGGGMVSGSVGQEEPSVLALADEAGIAIVSVEYRLAPEHQYPAQVDDCRLAWAWLHDNTAMLGVDPQRLCIGGSSAGAGLAAVLSINLRDHGGAAPIFQLLIYPMLDDRNTKVSKDSLDLAWNVDSNRFGWTSYIGRHAGTDHVPDGVVPARCDDLAGLPPAFIDVGDLDIFRDEAVAYANRLMQAGVSTELHVHPGAYHAFDRIAPDAEISRHARSLRTRAVRRAIGIIPAVTS